MGGSIALFMAAGEMPKLPAFLKNNSNIAVPVIKNYNTESGVWISRRGRLLEICYGFGGPDGEFAYFLAKSICVRFKVEKAGWDSIGYLKSIDDFIHGEPMRGIYFMLKRKKTIRGIRRQIVQYISSLSWE